MTPDPAEPRSWPRRRWWITLALVFGVQIGLIVWLSDRGTPPPRTTRLTPALHLFGPGSEELLALMNPTLLALPQPQGFSGPAWIHVTQPDFQPADWSEEPRWLALGAGELGSTFRQYLNSHPFEQVSGPAQDAPEPTYASRLEFPSRSAFTTVQIAGDLDNTQLITPMMLQSRPYTETLTNSVVQAVVDAKGEPISVTLVTPSTDAVADRQALDQTRAARFSPLVDHSPEEVTPPEQLRWAVLTFRWHPLPPAAGKETP